MKTGAMKRWRLACTLVLLISGCSSKDGGAPVPLSDRKEAPPATAGNTARIGVSLLKEDDEFYQTMKAEMLKTAKELGMELDVQSANNDLKRQTDQVDNFITRQVDAIVLCPVNSEGVVGAVKRANEAKIPVFTADIAAKGGDVVSHIASDNRQGGQLIAAKLISLLKGKGNVAIIGFPEVTSVADRVAGFREEIAKSGKDIKILDEVSARGERSESQKQASNLLLKHGKSLNAIFGINDNTALGAQAAAEQAGRTDLILVGYDGAKDAIESIKNSSRLLKADAVQYPDKIGRTTIETISKFLKGDKSIPKTVPVPCGVIDKETAK